MTTDLALDFGHEAMEPDPLADCYQHRSPADTARGRWLWRRGFTWGASEIGALLIAFGLAPIEHGAAAWVMGMAEHYKRLGIPKLIAWKAGIRSAPNNDNDATEGGTNLERPLFEEWKRTKAHEFVRPQRLHHSSAAPPSWFPLVDRQCPAIAISPDAWGYELAAAAEHVTIEVKNLRGRMEAPPWGYVQQVRAQMPPMGAARGLLVVGEFWLWKNAPEALRNIKTFVIEPSEEDTRRQYAAAREGKRLVDALKALAADLSTADMDARQMRQTLKARNAAGARCAELYEEARERLRPFRAQEAGELQDALTDIEIEITGLEGA